MERIREALVLIYDEEINTIEKDSVNSPEHSFTEEFEEKILSYVRFSERHYVPVSHFRIRKAAVIAVIAALVMTSAVVSIAIVKPSVIWNIQKKAVELKIPNGFTVKEESRHDSGYYVNYENHDGKFIALQQSVADDTKMYLNAESDERKTFKVDGHDAIAIHDEDTWVIVWDDGKYVYDLTGNVSYDELIRVIE